MHNPRPPLPDGPFVVVGLARSGVAAALALREAGAAVSGVDAGDVDPEARAALEAAGVAVHERTSGVEHLAGARSLVKSPGVRPSAPVVGAAAERRMTVIGELELAWRLLPNDWIAVTGTNGKTTTVELVGHIHRLAGLPVAVAGNVGVALTALIGRLEAAATVVAEASSFQLHDTELFAPEAAVLLNVSPDHEDWHGGFDAYRAAKLQVFARQRNEAVAVAPQGLGLEDLGGCARRVCFGPEPGAELGDRAGWLWWDEDPLIPVEEIRLRGLHNRRNAMAAAAVTLARGVAPDAVRQALREFAGVPHRLEEVAAVDAVAYVNDSKATNVDAALTGLRSFDGGVHLILGGRGKDQDFRPLAGAVAERCAAVYLIGEAAPALREALAAAGPPLHDCGDLERAVHAARSAAAPGETVLLSPACASFDQFADFEARGDAFREIVRALTR